MGNHPLRVEKLLNPEAVAVLTGTGWVIEGEEARFQFGDAETALWTGKIGGEDQFVFLLIYPGDAGQTIGEAQCRLE